MFSDTCNLLSIQLHYVSAYQKSLPIVLSPFTLSEILQIFFAFYFSVRIQLSWYVYQILEFFTVLFSFELLLLFYFSFFFFFIIFFFYINFLTFIFSSYFSSFFSSSSYLLQIDWFNCLLSNRQIHASFK